MVRSTTARWIAAALALAVIGLALERERQARAKQPVADRASLPRPRTPPAPPPPSAPIESAPVSRPERPARPLSTRRSTIAASVIVLAAGGAVAAGVLSRPDAGAARASTMALSVEEGRAERTVFAAPSAQLPSAPAPDAAVVPPLIATPIPHLPVTVSTPPGRAARPTVAAVQSLLLPAPDPSAALADLSAEPPPTSAEASATNAPTALPAPETPALAGLQQSLAPLFAGFAGHAGLAVVDLQTGEQLTIDGDQQFQAASTIKFFVVLSVLNDIEQGRYAFADVETDINGVMIQQNNYNARNLTRRTGIPTVNDRLRLWGLSRTIITHPSGFPEEHFSPYPTNDNLTSPSDAARGLLLLYRGRIAQPAASRMLIDHLTQAPRWYGIEGAVPDGEGRVFYKVGWLPEGDFSAVHDLGIVEFERGGRTLAYALAIYTQGAVPQWPAWALIRDAALQVWDFFAYQRYPATAVAAEGVAAVDS